MRFRISLGIAPKVLKQIPYTAGPFDQGLIITSIICKELPHSTTARQPFSERDVLAVGIIRHRSSPFSDDQTSTTVCRSSVHVARQTTAYVRADWWTV